MASVTAWLKPVTESGGLDHLGVQAPCINLYGRLLPGITNVTDRARYYSFYPWFFWACDQQYPTKVWEDLVEKYRRADCLLTLIALYHSRQTDQNRGLHRSAMIGVDTLTHAMDLLETGNTIQLSTYATREENTPERYFKNKLGGLGQYYLGVFKSLGLLDGNSTSGIQYTIERAVPIAKAYDKGVDRALFFQTIEKNVIGHGDLESLLSFCPCFLMSNQEEHKILWDLFFDTQNEHGDDGLQRRQTLSLLLHLIGSLPEGHNVLDHSLFRAVVYTGFLPNEQKLNIPDSLNETLKGWALYQRNELLSIATQCLFWTMLDLLEAAEEDFYTTEEFVSWVLKTDDVSKALADSNATVMEQVVGAKRKSMPAISDWEDEAHEIALGKKVLSLYAEHKRRRPHADIIRTSLDIVITLLARGGYENGYGEKFPFPEDYFAYYPINLRSLELFSNTEWKGMNPSELLGWLIGHWGIEAHLRVALHKMNRDRRDTFRVRPTDLGLKVVAKPEPVYTTPRFRQALQVLRDIGAIEKPDPSKNIFKLTQYGKVQLDEVG